MNKIIAIAQLGDAILRKLATPIIDFESEQLDEVIEQMLATLSHSKGVGLAAPQIGQSIAVIVIASKPNSRYPNAPLMSPIVMINPTFQSISKSQKKEWEGCLSIPGIRALIPRYQAIKINYKDRLGTLVTIELEGFIARIFQHEYDHLQGLVYLDRVETNRDIISEVEFFKLLP